MNIVYTFNCSTPFRANWLHKTCQQFGIKSILDDGDTIIKILCEPSEMIVLRDLFMEHFKNKSEKTL